MVEVVQACPSPHHPLGQAQTPQPGLQHLHTHLAPHSPHSLVSPVPHHALASDRVLTVPQISKPFLQPLSFPG